MIIAPFASAFTKVVGTVKIGDKGWSVTF